MRAFTLVELAIVLVIIGLIIGGVLVGRDLIAQAAIRGQIGQIDQYNAAARTFQIKYGGLPGDLNLRKANEFGFYTTGCSGGTAGQRDGNDIIQQSSQVMNHLLSIAENRIILDGSQPERADRRHVPQWRRYALPAAWAVQEP